MRKVVPIVSLILILFVCYLAYWLFNKPASHAPEKIKPIPVSVTQVTSELLPQSITAVGTIYADQSVALSAQIAGAVTQILVPQGQAVEQGAALIQLDDATYRANLESAQAQLTLSQLDFDRMNKLAKEKALAKQQLDQAKAELKQKQAAVAIAQANLAKTTIRAPFAGALGAKQVNIGQYVTVGEALATLVDTSNLKVSYLVPENLLPEIKLSQKVIVHSSNYPHKQFVGEVNFIAPAINLTSRSVEVQAKINNPDELLKPGQFVKVTQITNANQQALVIPAQSLVPSIEGQRVYVVVNGRARAVPVEVDERFGDRVAVLKGLSAGDIVVTAGQQRLKDGMPVTETK